MKNKSNTQAIIQIWMKACFEKLLQSKSYEFDRRSAPVTDVDESRRGLTLKLT